MENHEKDFITIAVYDTQATKGLLEKISDTTIKLFKKLNDAFYNDEIDEESEYRVEYQQHPKEEKNVYSNQIVCYGGKNPLLPTISFDIPLALLNTLQSSQSPEEEVIAIEFVDQIVDILNHYKLFVSQALNPRKQQENVDSPTFEEKNEEDIKEKNEEDIKEDERNAMFLKACTESPYRKAVQAARNAISRLKSISH